MDSGIEGPPLDDLATSRRADRGGTRRLRQGRRRSTSAYTCRVDPARKLATYDDLLALPQDVRAEILGGMMAVPPAPPPRHSRAQGALRSLIGRPYDDDHGRGGPGGWWIFVEVDVRLSPHDVVRPDLGGWKRGRLPSPWDTRPIDVVPDWIAEIVSPSNAAQDRVDKRALYARAGVAFYWIVDPTARTLEALRLDAATGAWVELGAYGDGSVARIPPFDEVDLEIARLFPPRETEGSRAP
jgi:Uma2 family endonuclease